MLPSPGFCKHAVWIFGVLVGLSIEAAITRVGPHLLTFEGDATRSMQPELWRLIVFILLSVRLYLGATHVFDTLHAEALTPICTAPGGQLTPEEKTRLVRAGRQFGVDFFAGLLHFVALSGLSLTLVIHPLDRTSAEPLPSEWMFRFVLLFMLCWDVVWVISRPRPHPRALKVWMVINLVTAIGISYGFYHLHVKRNWSSLDAEVPMLIVVALMSVVDISELTMGVEFFSKAAVFVCRGLGAMLRWVGDRITSFGTSIERKDR